MAGTRGPLALIAALLGLFLGGAAIGGALAETFAPESFVADVVSFFALPLAFAIAMQAWFGLALFGLAIRLVGLGRRSGTTRDASVPVATTPIPGSFVFLPLSSAAGAVAGLVVGLISPTHSVWLVWFVYWAVGTVHGLLGWRLARAGVLVPPESI